MASEKALWNTFKGAYVGDVQRHEDSVAIGIPDVSYAFRLVPRCVGAPGCWSGWIELKEADVARRGNVDVDLKDWQKAWLVTRGVNGQDCWVLVQIGRYYYWYYWSALVGRDINEMTVGQHRANCTHFFYELTTQNISDALSHPIRI